MQTSPFRELFLRQPKLRPQSADVLPKFSDFLRHIVTLTARMTMSLQNRSLNNWWWAGGKFLMYDNVLYLRRDSVAITAINNSEQSREDEEQPAFAVTTLKRKFMPQMSGRKRLRRICLGRTIWTSLLVCAVSARAAYGPAGCTDAPRWQYRSEDDVLTDSKAGAYNQMLLDAKVAMEIRLECTKETSGTVQVWHLLWAGTDLQSQATAARPIVASASVAGS